MDKAALVAVSNKKCVMRVHNSINKNNDDTPLRFPNKQDIPYFFLILLTFPRPDE